MKNIVITHNFQSHYTIGFANGIADNGIDLTIITDERQHPQLRTKIRRRNLVPENKPSRSAARKLIEYAIYHLKLLAYVAVNFGSTLHIIGTLRFPVAEGILELLLFRILSRRVILTVHNILPHGRHTTYNKFIHYLIYRIPQYIVVHTQKMKNELMDSYGILEPKIIVMEHGINSVIDEPTMSKSACKSLLGIPEDKFVLLMFGHVSPYKGIETLLECFELLDEGFYLLIAGMATDQEYANTLYTKIKANKFSSNIGFYNEFIDDKDIPSYFSASDVLALPYKHINQSGMIFLTMKLGLPVIAFDTGSLADYINSDIGIIVQQKDAEGLSDAVKAFKNNIGHYSPATIQNYAKKYDWKNTVKAVTDLYAPNVCSSST